MALKLKPAEEIAPQIVHSTSDYDEIDSIDNIDHVTHDSGQNVEYSVEKEKMESSEGWVFEDSGSESNSGEGGGDKGERMGMDIENLEEALQSRAHLSRRPRMDKIQKAIFAMALFILCVLLITGAIALFTDDSEAALAQFLFDYYVLYLIMLPVLFMVFLTFASMIVGLIDTFKKEK